MDVASREDSGAESDTSLSAVLADLYAVAPDEFVTTRTMLAQELKARGDAALAKEVGRLRRPTVSAWAVNRLVRERPDQVGALREVGRRLRAAQGQLDAAALRDLRPERDRLVAGWAEAAAEVTTEAGRPLPPAALDEVRATVIAALAGEEATDAVASGHLTRALSYSGFGEVDLSEAVVRTSSGAVLTVVPAEGPSDRGREEATQKLPEKLAAQKPAPPQPASTSKATKAAPSKAEDAAAERPTQEPAQGAERQRRVEEARGLLAAATETAREAALSLDQARDRADETRWRVEELDAQLKQARAEHRDAEQAATAAARARRAAEVEVAKAERAVREAENAPE